MVLIDSGTQMDIFCMTSPARIRGDLQGLRGTQGGPQRRLARPVAVLRPSWYVVLLDVIIEKPIWAALLRT